MEGLHGRDERRRTSRLDAHGWPGQIQFVGDASRSKVLVAPQRDLELTETTHQVFLREDMLLQVCLHANPGEDANPPRIGLRHMAGRLEHLPGDLEQESVLGVYELRFLGRNPEECGVEELDVLEHPARVDVVRILRQVGREAGIEVRGSKVSNGIQALAQILPEDLDAGRTWETPTHPDDGNVAEGRAGLRGSRPLGESWLLPLGA